MKVLFYVLSVLATALMAEAQGSFEAMVNFVATNPTNGSPVYSGIYAGINGPMGWTFQTSSSIEVTSLGAFSYVVPSHGNVTVGLWNASGALLASATINAQSTLVDQSRFQAIAPLFLTAGQTYYLAAELPPLGSAIAVTPGSAPNGYAVMDPNIQLGQVAYSASGSFTFPSTLDGLPGYAIIAPNFQFSVVPEPSTVSLIGGGVLTVFAFRSRRK